MNPGTDVRRVLIYRLGSLGDTVVALPCFHLIESAFPNAERRLLTNIPVHGKAPAAAAVLGESGLVHGYISYPVGMRSLRDILSVQAEIRRFRPDLLVYLAALRGERAATRDRWFFRLCGLRKMVGYPASTEDFKRQLLPDRESYEPEAARLARSIGILGDASLDHDSSWDLRLTPAERQRADEIQKEWNGARLLVVSLGTKAQANDWGDANWSALLTRLSAMLPDHRLALIGAADEKGSCDRAAAAWHDRTLNLCGALAPRESAALLQSADLFIGHDSGPMHLAAAVGTPCVAIFSARNLPGVWFPRGQSNRVIYHRTDCAGCGLTTCIEQKRKCILSITVEEALAAVRESLGANLNPGPTVIPNS